MAEPSVNSEPGNCHELIKSDDRGLLESGLAKLQMVGRDQTEMGPGSHPLFGADGSNWFSVVEGVNVFRGVGEEREAFPKLSRTGE